MEHSQRRFSIVPRGTFLASDSQLFHVKHLAHRKSSLLHSRCNLGDKFGASHCHRQSKGRCRKNDNSRQSRCLSRRFRAAHPNHRLRSAGKRHQCPRFCQRSLPTHSLPGPHPWRTHRTGNDRCANRRPRSNSVRQESRRCGSRADFHGKSRIPPEGSHRAAARKVRFHSHRLPSVARHSYRQRAGSERFSSRSRSVRVPGARGSL